MKDVKKCEQCSEKEKIYYKILETKVNFRINEILTVYNKFTKKRDGNFFMCKSLLSLAVKKYFDEIEVFRFTGDIETFGDKYKRASGTIKWFCTIKPIQLKELNPSSANKRNAYNAFEYLINEIFSIFVALNFLDLDFKEIDKEYLRELLIILQRCSLDIDLLTTQMMLLDAKFHTK